jgi:subfamily B ATP-binding cassette protein MsbA
MGDLGILAKYHRLLRPYIGIFLIAILFDVVMTLVGLLNPLFTRVLFDYAFPFKNITLLNVSIIAIAVAYFIYFFLSVMADYLQIYVNQETTARLTKKLYHAIQCLPLSFHQKKKSGDLLVRLTDDVSTTTGVVSHMLPTLVIDGGRLIAILTIAFIINPLLTLLALLSVPLYILETKFYARRMQWVEAEAIDAQSDLFTHAGERLANIKTIKAFQQEQRETLSFSMLLRRRYQIGVKGKLIEVVATFTNSITLQMWMLFITWFLGYQVVRGQLTIGEIIALLLYFEQLDDPIRTLMSMFTGWKTSMVSMRRIDEVLETPFETSGDKFRKALTLDEGRVITDKLTFSYPEEEAVLNDIEVEFKPRSVTAIVGASGSGKTTLANLLLRFFDPGKKAIFIDGQDISETKITSLRDHLGLIAQEYTLFDGTILDNILYGNEGRSFEDAVKAAKLASAYDFIVSFPQGFEEEVGAGGQLLSGGQRQRIAIARTLLKDPEIIVFDEATSALDPESEFKIQEIIHRLSHSKTVIVIAHRLSTIKSADKIMVLDEGRFVEKGTFDELIDLKGAFYRFYWRQFGGLANLRQQLGMEYERSARYGSRFGVAILKVEPYGIIMQHEGIDAAHWLMREIEYILENSIRLGDNCSVLDENYILLLAPEILPEQMESFFQRMIKLIADAPLEALGHHLRENNLLFVGTHITKKIFRTPEELVSALKHAADSSPQKSGIIIIGEDELEKNHAET